MLVRWFLFTLLASLCFAQMSFAEAPQAPAAQEAAAAPVAPQKVIKPYRTFITIQRYNVNQVNDTISNVRLEITFPNQAKVQLPESGQYWPVGNGQVQDINRTYELPYAYIQNDGFKFKIQMIRKGGDMLPCEFEITELSQFNRAYVCHTDEGWQQSNNIAPEKMDKEGVQVRVFTDINARPNEIPNDSLALR